MGPGYGDVSYPGDPTLDCDGSEAPTAYEEKLVVHGPETCDVRIGETSLGCKTGVDTGCGSRVDTDLSLCGVEHRLPVKPNAIVDGKHNNTIPDRNGDLTLIR